MKMRLLILTVGMFFIGIIAYIWSLLSPRFPADSPTGAEPPLPELEPKNAWEPPPPRRMAASPLEEPPEPNSLLEEALADPATQMVFVHKISRHNAMLSFLESPARGTSECAELERICKRNGLMPWAVPLAYMLSWQSTMQEDALRDLDSEQSLPVVRQLMMEMFQRQNADSVKTMESLYGIKLEPAFIEQVSLVRPKVFFGSTLALDGPVDPRFMLDEVDWGDPRLAASRPSEP